MVLILQPCQTVENVILATLEQLRHCDLLIPIDVCMFCLPEIYFCNNSFSIWFWCRRFFSVLIYLFLIYYALSFTVTVKTCKCGKVTSLQEGTTVQSRFKPISKMYPWLQLS